jgi:hypothetical protein
LRKELLGDGMLTHDFAGALAIVEKAWIGDLALQLLEALSFAIDQGLEIHKTKTAIPRRFGITVR